MNFSSVVGGAVQRVRVRTQIGPEFVWDPNAPAAAGGDGGLSSLLMGFVKPAIIVDTPAGAVPVAPWGEPTENYGPVLAIAGVVFVVGLVTAIGWVARKI